MITLVEKLNKIQVELNAPKNQRNNFGGYNYRSCEDIMQAIKPLLAKTGLVLTVCDDIEYIGNRFYIKAIATITDGVNSISNCAFAREPESKKGMDEAQITGATSSYARKYALNGLLCIDDVKDADATNTHGKEMTAQKTPAQKAAETRKENTQEFETRFAKMYAWFKTNPSFSYTIQDNFERLMQEASKRNYDKEKCEEMLAIWDGLEKDSIPNFEVK